MSKVKPMMTLATVTAVASSLCCITPVAAILAGSSSLDTSVVWMNPLRPWFIGLTLAALICAWYLQLRTKKQEDGKCKDKHLFWNGRPFLGLVTLFSLLMLSFPTYADIFFSPSHSAPMNIVQDALECIQIEIQGMSCDGCEGHVEHAIKQLPGVHSVQASYMDANAVVKYDPAQLNINGIKAAILTTTYQVGKHQIVGVPKNE